MSTIGIDQRTYNQIMQARMQQLINEGHSERSAYNQAADEMDDTFFLIAADVTEAPYPVTYRGE
jgi:hypothetical protein